MKIFTARINKKMLIIPVILLTAVCVLNVFFTKNKITKYPSQETKSSTENMTEKTDTTELTEGAETAKHMKDKNGNDYIPKSNVTVYLTFDDGPSKNTPQILALLEKYGIGATFFVINGQYNDYMKDIANSKSVLALHSYSHKYPEIYSSEKAFLDDLEKIHDLVKSETGVDTKIIRFPGGSSNTISRKYCRGIMTNLVKDVEEEGFVYFDWNCDSGDAEGRELSAEKQIKKATQYSKNAENIVILMHDINTYGVSLEALSGIIDFYQSEGFDFGVITENSPLVHHKVNN